MYNLPDLVIELVYEYLSYHDLLNLRLTCKKLKCLIDQKKFQRLYLFSGIFHPYRDLFYTNELISYSNSFRVKYLFNLNSFKFKNNFDQLQKLIVDSSQKHVNLNQLNNFTQLLHFEMGYVQKIEGKLSLNNLQIASFDTNEDSSFELDCPNLKALRLENEAQPKLVGNTNNLKYLCIYSRFPTFDYPLNPSILQNFSTICLSYYGLLNHLLTNINHGRLNLRSLKRIEMNKIFKFYYSGIDEFYSIMTKVMYNLSVFTKCPSKKHVQIFINNQLSNLKDFKAIVDGIIKLSPNNWSTHYDLIKSSFQDSNVLERFLPEIENLTINNDLELDEKMIKKMKNLNSINFECKLEKFIFQQILKIQPSIHFLHFHELNFESSELDQLPNYFPYLVQMTLPKGFKADGFYFIRKLKNLDHLTIQQVQAERQVFTDLLGNGSKLSSILVFGKHQRILMYTKEYDSDEFDFRMYRFKSRFLYSEKVGFDTLDSMLDFYYKNNLFYSEFNKFIE